MANSETDVFPVIFFFPCKVLNFKTLGMACKKIVTGLTNDVSLEAEKKCP